MTSPRRVDIRLLGGFDVRVDGVIVPPEAWRRRRAAALVKLLALQPGQRMRREAVIDSLWPDLLLDEAAPRLHKAAFYGRSALGARHAVVLSDDSVALFPDAAVEVDVDAFEQAASAAAGEAGPDLRLAAVDRYGGDLLPDDVYEPWTEEPRERCRMRYLTLLRELGRWEDVLALDPLDEEAHLEIVSGLIQRGDRSGAERRLEHLERLFDRELGKRLSADAEALRAEAATLPVIDPARDRRPAQAMTPPPSLPTRTIGRDADVSRLIELLDQARLITLLGPGGVGKTRLVLEAAHRHHELTGTPSCFVDLTKISDPELLPWLISQEMGLHTGGPSSEQALHEALRGRSLLLVLDNFEHITEAAGTVSRLFDWAEGLAVLVTSRARLRIDAEQVFEVSPLRTDAEPLVGSVPEAAALFAQVAQTRDPDFRLEPHVADVSAICEQVDGLPLAIELAAGHVRTLSPRLLRARLGVRLASPEGASRDRPPRQQTILATIDWSLQLLGAPERRLFAELGVFAGPVPVEMIDQVCGGDEDVVPMLGQLVDQSLVKRVPGRNGETRFVLLELLREHARGLLADEDREYLAARHAAAVAARLDALDDERWTTASADWIDEISQQLPEIRSAHAWAERRGDVAMAARISAGLGTYWHREGHYEEGRVWVGSVLPHLNEFSVPMAARLQLAAGFLEWPRDLLVTREHWMSASAMFRMLGHDRYLAYSLALTSVTFVGDEPAFDDAIKLCDEAIELARRVGERPLIAQALNIKGELTRVHGDDATALMAYEEGRSLAEAAGDDAHLSLFLANLGYLVAHAGNHQEARRLGREALELSWSQGRRMLAAWMVSELAAPEVALHRPERGALLVGAADQALETLGAARHPVDWTEHAAVLQALRTTLGEEEFARLHSAGAELSLDEAVELALSDPRDDQEGQPLQRTPD